MRSAMLIAAILALVLAAWRRAAEVTTPPTRLARSTDPLRRPPPGVAAVSEHAEHAVSAPADCSPSGTTVSVVASGTKFNTACLAAPADQPFTLSYENRDSIAHNIVFLESHTATSVMFRADIFTGPKTSTFSVPALRPGTYAFHCEVHPSVMTGALIVKLTP